MSGLHKSTLVFHFILAMAIGYAGQTVMAFPQESESGEAGERLEGETVNALIGQLSDASYKVRHLAARRLQAVGEPAIAAVARASLQGHPETRFQCLKILQSIARESQGATQFKAALVMRLLAKNGHPQLAHSIGNVIHSWRVKKTESNIQHLEKMGADVVRSEVRAGRVGFAFQMRASSGEPNEPAVDEGTSDEARNQPSRLTRAELSNRIETIVASDANELEKRFVSEVVAQDRPERVSETEAGPGTVIIGGDVVVLDELVGANPRGEAVSIQTVTLDEEWKGSIEDLEYLKLLPRVPILRIRNRPITDEMFNVFADVPGLNYIVVEQASFNPEAFKKFFNQHPQIQYSLSPKAFLGVRSVANRLEPGEQPCEISAVIPDSAAEEAGIEVGDVIRQVDDEPVKEFEDLILAIATRQVGDTLTIQLDRDGESVEVSATLKERDDVVIVD